MDLPKSIAILASARSWKRGFVNGRPAGLHARRAACCEEGDLRAHLALENRWPSVHVVGSFSVISVVAMVFIRSMKTLSKRQLPKRSNQTPFFFYPTNVNWQLGQTKKKHSAAPPEIEFGSSDCRSDALTTELRSHDRNCVRIFVFHQTVSSFSLFFFSSDPAVSSHLSDRKRKEFD